ncbi:MAG: HepT-like ribonuclease domain-containing protein [Acidimicrobiales bacterium]
MRPTCARERREPEGRHRLSTPDTCRVHQRLSPACKERHPEIPWKQIAGFRNRVVHGYLDVGVETLWGIVERDLPTLWRSASAELALHRDKT